jgi:hypothetical protein
MKKKRFEAYLSIDKPIKGNNITFKLPLNYSLKKNWPISCQILKINSIVAKVLDIL